MEYTLLTLRNDFSKLNDEEIFNVINQLKNKNGNKYDINLIRSEFQKPIKITKGKWNSSSFLKNREILLVASGEELKRNKKTVEKYIEEKKPIVIALKTIVPIKKKLINYYIACNPLRIMNEIKNYSNLKTFNSSEDINNKI